MSDKRSLRPRWLFRLPWTTASLRREIDDEIRFHLDHRREELMRFGMPEHDARETAEREFGDAAESKRELFELDRRRLVQEHRRETAMSLLEDLRYAARGLRRRPAMTAVIVFTLTAGIAANAVMFSVTDQLLIQPPPQVAAPGLLKRLYFQERRDNETITIAATGYPMVAALRERVSAFQEIAAHARATYSLGRGEDARSVEVELASGNYFTTLGVRAALGRVFGEIDDAPPNGSPVAVISDGLWKRVFGSSPDAVRRSIELNGKLFTIVGVAPPGFSGIDQANIDVWAPISAVAAEAIQRDWRTASGSYWLQTFGRLRAGSTQDQATAQATTAFRAQLRISDLPWRDTAGVVALGPITATRTPTGMSSEGRVALWLLGVSAMVFLIACANVANLLIGNMLQRRREISVRLALGVSRARLLQHFIVEALLLAALSAVAALAVAQWGGRVVHSILLPGLVLRPYVVDLRLLAFTAAITVGCVLFAGLIPAIQGVRTSVSEGLKVSSRQVAGQRGMLRASLLSLQALLSVVLLVGAGLFLRSLHHVSTRDVGIRLDRVLLARMNVRQVGFSPAESREIYENAVERARRIPGVLSASVVAGSVPMSSGRGINLTIPGRPDLPRIPGGGPYYSIVGADFFATTGTRLLRGRLFTPGEERGGARAMVISDLVAKSYWPNEDPVGKCVGLGSDTACTEILGVVQNVLLFRLVGDDRATIYLSPSHPRQANTPPAALIVRTASTPGAVIPTLRRELQSISAGMPYVNVSSFEDLVAPQMRPWRLGATMFTLFGTLALLIAAVGLYSVLAHWVSQRTHEIGVRMALGAQRRDIIRLVAWKGAAPVLIGLASGLAIAALASRWVSTMLYETSRWEPTVYAAAALVLGFAAVAASLIPAVRSTSVDPVTALRAE